MLPATEDETTSKSTIENLNETTNENVAIAINATFSEATPTTTIITVTTAASLTWTEPKKSTNAQTTEINSFLNGSLNQQNVAVSLVHAAQTLPHGGQDQSTSNENASTLIATTLNEASANSTISPPPSTDTNVIKTAMMQAVPIGSHNRSQQRQKIKNYQDAKQTAWRTALTASNLRQSFRDESIDTKSFSDACIQDIELPHGAILKSASSHSAEGAISLPRRVSFPAGDKDLVTGYLEPANPWEHANLVKNISEITNLYMLSCKKHNTKPLETVLDHLKVVDLNSYARQPRLSLKYLKLAPNDCEPLEEVFKRIQYKLIELSGCSLDESAVSALCQMIEYYEAANELDISYNKEGMTHRGWTSCTYMVGRSQELHVLNAEGNVISKLSAESLGNALNTSNLHTLKLEHCGLKGAPLTSFCCKLYKNKLLKELWLAYNDLDCTDAAHIADLLRCNHYIELVDISNNNIRDEGMMYLVQALLMQSSELERRLNLHRATAIEDDSLFPMDESISINSNYVNINDIVEDAGTTLLENPSTSFQENVDTNNGCSNSQTHNIDASDTACCREKQLNFEFDDTKSTTSPVDNDSDDTLKSRGNASKATNIQNQAGQSMLDKLLSMNSDSSSSSEDGPSIISSDSIVGWCSKDESVNNNELDATESIINKDVATKPMVPSKTSFSSSMLNPSAEGDGTLVIETNMENLSLMKTSSGEDVCLLTDASNILYNEQNLNIVDVNDTTSTTASSPTSSSHKSNGSRNSIFELTSEESFCVNNAKNNGVVTRQVDVNKGTKSAIEDYEDSHSTDSAFESASEGDISRHLPDEFSRLSGSLESTRLDEIAKEISIETATIATESTECLAIPEGVTTSVLTPVLVETFNKPADASITKDLDDHTPPNESIAADCLQTQKQIDDNTSADPSSLPTPPTPSPSSCSLGSVMYRSESNTQYLSQSVRVHSQSSDSLCSDTSLDGSSSLTDHNLVEKLTKNDTLSRRNLVNFSMDANNKSQSGLKALTVWNNNLTKDSGKCISELLSKSVSLELLNIGKNCLSNDFVTTIKDSLIKNTTLTTLGLQSAHLSAKGIETLASILTFGGNNSLQRIDIRDNKLDVESLNIIADVLKSNKTITQIDINDEPKRLTIGSDAHLRYARVLENVRSMCSRNEKIQTKLQVEKTINVGSSGNNSGNRCRGGYYLGSRKISLTCHSRPLVDVATGTVTSSGSVSTASTVTPTPAAKLVVKRKSGVRLRSPGPSPPAISPSSSPNRSRFQVSRVHEVSPLKSPLAQIPPSHLPMSISAAATTASSGCVPFELTTPCLPTSCSLPTMASAVSSTQTVGRHSVSPCSRFHVSRIFEDPQVPLSRHLSSQLTPPLKQPPTIMTQSAETMTQLPAQTDATNTVSTVVIVEPAVSDIKQNVESSVFNFIPSTNESHLPTHSSTNLFPSDLQHSAQQSISSNVSSTSTSPISLNSSSSSSLLSSSPSLSTMGETKNITTTTNSSSQSVPLVAVPLADCTDSKPVPKICPIVVFGDNDITLTKESAANLGISSASAQNRNDAIEMSARPPVTQHQDPEQQQKSSKISWIANPTAVDKLLTLFNSSTIFQRNSSQESKTRSHSMNSSYAKNSESNDYQESEEQDIVTGACIIPSTSRSKNNTDMPNDSTSSSSENNNSTNFSSMSNAAAVTLEQSLYFLDTASRQFRDFSKTVFKQNLSIGNDSSVAASYEPSTSASASASANSTASSTELSECCDVAHIPINIKNELKENISPKHTINEDTLHSLQKLAKVEEPQTGVDNICKPQTVTHDNLVDCLEGVDDSTQEQTETYSAAARVAKQNT